MLELLHRLARPLARWQLAGWAVMLAAAAAFAVGTLRYDASTGLPLASLIVALWSGLLVAVVKCFASPPPQHDPRASLPSRLKRRLQRGFLWLLAGGLLVAFGLVAFVSIRSVRLLFEEV